MKRLTPILALALAACGGGGEPAAVADAPACTVSILLNGDSTNWGYAQGGSRASVYPELALQQALDARFGAGRVLVSTGAVPGSTSTDALDQPRNADLVVYNPGINDVAYGHGESQYWAAMRVLARVPGAVFQTPLPVAGAEKDYAGIMREAALEAGVPLIEARTAADWGTLQADGVHPTAAGYAVLGRDVLAPALAPLVADKLGACQ